MWKLFFGELAELGEELLSFLTFRYVQNVEKLGFSLTKNQCNTF